MTSIYHLYGLTIESEIRLPELPLGTGEPDIKIQYGTVPNIYNEKVKDDRFYADKNCLFLRFRKNVSYLISNGNHILVEVRGTISEYEVRLMLLGSALTGLMHQRGFLVLHGSAVEYNGKSIIFTGESGEGKSTIATALYKSGFNVLTDDVCVIDFNNNIPEIIPSYPRLRLNPDSAEYLTEIKSPQLEDYEKHTVDLMNHFQRCPVALSHIFLLKETTEKKVQVTELEGQDKISLIFNNTYRYLFVKLQALTSLHFAQCTQLANTINVAHFHRQKTFTQLPASVDYLVKYLR